MKKTFKYVERMLPLFCAVVKVCSTNRLFNHIHTCSQKQTFTHFTEIKHLSGLAQVLEPGVISRGAQGVNPPC